MPLELPFVPSIPFQEVDVPLDGAVYRMYLQWSTRERVWYLDISTTDDELVAAGLKLVLGTYIGWRVVDERFPRGLIRMFANSDAGVEAGLDDLGVRVVAHYYTTEELFGV